MKSQANGEGLLLIGRKETVAFPAWGLRHVRAKIDTGAYSSALDVSAYDLYEAAGIRMVRLRLASRRHPGRVREVEAPLLGTTIVASSSGTRETRPLIEATVCLGPVTRSIRLTVTNRSGMRYPLLLGRQALAGNFLVDVSRKDLLRSAPEKR
jgi:hypothetical protein